MAPETIERNQYGHYRIIPVSDYAFIQTVYSHSEPVKDLTPERFVQKFESRIFTEWCCGEGSFKNHSPYSPDRLGAFLPWRNNEVKNVLEHDGNHWDQVKNRFIEDISEPMYEAARREVLNAMVYRGKDFFAACSGEWLEPPRDVHLRTNLMGYVIAEREHPTTFTLKHGELIAAIDRLD